jgi:hypothetical protein
VSGYHRRTAVSHVRGLACRRSGRWPLSRAVSAWRNPVDHGVEDAYVASVRPSTMPVTPTR